MRTIHKQSSLPVDEPVRIRANRSPARRKESSVIHVMNLVRPFTLPQLKDLLGKYGPLADDAFWMDKIKSHCFVGVSERFDQHQRNCICVVFPCSNVRLTLVTGTTRVITLAYRLR